MQRIGNILKKQFIADKLINDTGKHFVGCMKTSCKNIKYLKTKKGKKTPDYLVDDNGTNYIIEVGGKGKGIQQFKGIEMSKSIIFADGERLDGIKRPLFLAVFLK